MKPFRSLTAFFFVAAAIACNAITGVNNLAFNDSSAGGDSGQQAAGGQEATAGSAGATAGQAGMAAKGGVAGSSSGTCMAGLPDSPCKACLDKNCCTEAMACSDDMDCTSCYLSGSPLASGTCSESKTYRALYACSEGKGACAAACFPTSAATPICSSQPAPPQQARSACLTCCALMSPIGAKAVSDDFYSCGCGTQKQSCGQYCSCDMRLAPLSATCAACIQAPFNDQICLASHCTSRKSVDACSKYRACAASCPLK